MLRLKKKIGSERMKMKKDTMLKFILMLFCLILMLFCLIIFFYLIFLVFYLSLKLFWLIFVVFCFIVVLFLFNLNAILLDFDVFFVYFSSFFFASGLFVKKAWFHRVGELFWRCSGKNIFTVRRVAVKKNPPMSFWRVAKWLRF